MRPALNAGPADHLNAKKLLHREPNYAVRTLPYRSKTFNQNRGGSAPDTYLTNGNVSSTRKTRTVGGFHVFNMVNMVNALTSAGGEPRITCQHLL